MFLDMYYYFKWKIDMFEILELYDMYFLEFFCVIRFFILYIFVDEKVNKYDFK